MVINPFGVKDGRIISVNDLTDSERGIKCHCFCPLCNAPFVARLGDINVHHFAHSGESCNEVKAYMQGAYRLIKQQIEDNNGLFLPSCYIEYDLSKFATFDSLNIIQYCKFRTYDNPILKTIKITDAIKIGYDSLEFECNNKSEIKALLLKIKNTAIAIIIKPPSTICKIYSVNKYKDFSTIEIDLTNYGAELLQYTSEQIANLIIYSTENKHWIYNKRITKYIDSITKDVSDYKKMIEKEAAQMRVKKEIENKHVDDLWEKDMFSAERLRNLYND